MAARTLVVLLAALAAAPASGAPSWTTPVSVPADPATTMTKSVWIDGGAELTARVHVQQPVDINAVVTSLVVSRTPPGGAPVDEVTLASTPTAVPSGFCLAVAPNGAAVLAYTEGISNDFSPPPANRYRTMWRSTDGVWESATLLFADPVPHPAGLGSTLLCAIAPDGTAVAGAAHIEPDDAMEPAPGQPDMQIDLALRPAGGAWQASQRLSAANVSADHTPLLGVDDAANFTIVWNSRYSEGPSALDTNDRWTLLVRRLLAGQTVWNVAEDVTQSSPGSDFMNAYGFAVGGDGRAVIAFVDGVTSQVSAAVRPNAAQPFSAPVPIITTGSSSAPYATAIAPDGTAYVLYNFDGNDSGERHVGMAKLPPAGSWTSGTPVSPLSFNIGFAGIGFVDADLLAVWSGQLDGSNLVQATRWAAGAASPEAFRDLDQTPSFAQVDQVVSDRAGSVVADWHTSTEQVRAAYDAGPPMLTASTVSTNLVAGIPATFGAAFLDLWSAIPGAPAWTFGDGDAGSGAEVTHTFAVPGTYAVTVRAADAFDNEAVEMVEVTVADCESLAGIESVGCRCGNGLAIVACGTQPIPGAATSKFGTACAKVDAARAGTGKKARKAASKAAKTFKKAGRVLGGKAGKALTDECRNALGAVLEAARQQATALRDAL